MILCEVSNKWFSAKFLRDRHCVTLVMASRSKFKLKMVSGRFVQWTFRSKYKKLFRSEPEICLTDSFFYLTKE